jgi:two-component system, sensor histidine kinase and response regulator
MHMNGLNEHPCCQDEVLIVDDTPLNLQLLSTILNREGYSVRCAIGGEMALRSVKAAPPDLILLDITMPGMDGYEVCRRLKVDSSTSAIPVIFISALDASCAKEQALAVGGLDYITKPYRVRDILSKVQKVLKVCHLRPSATRL